MTFIPTNRPAPRNGARGVNGEKVSGTLENGYLTIHRQWRANEVVQLDFAMPVQTVHGNEKIAATQGQVCFERGPVVYCVEAVKQSLPSLPLASPIALTPTRKADFFHDAVTLQVRPANQPAFTAIPYYAWNNRGLAPMTVWVNQSSVPTTASAQ
ncbi:MAG: glycoside hydrolase family 127 protein [Chthoniobacteraceae bacterium]